MLLAVCCVNPLVSLHAPAPALFAAFRACVPVSPSDEAPPRAGNLSEEPEASESDALELALDTRDDVVPGELSSIVSFWHGRGVEPWHSSPNPRPGERA